MVEAPAAALAQSALPLSDEGWDSDRSSDICTDNDSRYNFDNACHADGSKNASTCHQLKCSERRLAAS